MVSEVELTPPLILAAGRHAGNRAMRTAGRARWNEDDANVAGETFAYLSVVAGKLTPENYADLGWGVFKKRAIV